MVKPRQDPDGWNMPGQAAPEKEQPQKKEEEEEEVDRDDWDSSALQKMSVYDYGFASACYGAPPPQCGGAFPAPQPIPPPYSAPVCMSAAGGFGGGLAKLAAAPLAAIPCRGAPMAMMAPAAAPGGPIGFKTGGAQDVCNYRENVKQGHLPLPTDVTFEGVVKDYFFNCANEGEAETERCTDLFFPTYSLALAPDPLLAAAAAASQPAAGSPPEPGTAADAETTAAAAEDQDGFVAVVPPKHPPPPPSADIFLSVGLDSGMTEFKRPKLNLVLLLDVSGSMDCTFDSYYYDAATGKRVELTRSELRSTKLDVAKEVLLGMMDLLREDDSVSVVLFSDKASTPKPLGPMRTAKRDAIKAGVNALRTVGGTNLQAGMDLAAKEFAKYSGFRSADPLTTENRLVILTDAEPNAGDFTGDGLMARLKAAALDGIHTTFIGVGLDFNTALVEDISKVKGGNYYSVHSPGEFKRRLCDDFDCMVSPLVFDLALKVDPYSMAAGWKILHAYGTPNPQDSALSEDGTVMKIHTLFPSPKTEEGIKGGVVLLRMSAPSSPKPGSPTPAPLALSVTYRDRSGQPFASRKEVPLPAWAAGGGGVAAAAVGGAVQPALFQSSGVRKAVALARYVDALQSWLVDQASGSVRAMPPLVYLAAFGTSSGPGPTTHHQRWLAPGQRLVPPAPDVLSTASKAGQHGSWERTSRPLAVSAESKAALRVLRDFMRSEAAAVGDPTLQQEVDLLGLLLEAPEGPTGSTGQAEAGWQQQQQEGKHEKQGGIRGFFSRLGSKSGGH